MKTDAETLPCRKSISGCPRFLTPRLAQSSGKSHSSLSSVLSLKCLSMLMGTVVLRDSFPEMATRSFYYFAYLFYLIFLATGMCYKYIGTCHYWSALPPICKFHKDRIENASMPSDTLLLVVQLLFL